MLQLNYKQIKACNEVFRRLNQLRRWTIVVSKGTQNELNKQALNCIIAYILASFVENSGLPIVWERFPKVALYRAFQKVYVVFNTPKYKYDEIFELGSIPKSALFETTKQKISENVDEEFSNFLCESVGTTEEKIFKAATKIATYIELLSLEPYCSLQLYHKKLKDIFKEIQEYIDIPGMNILSDSDTPLFQLLQFISNSGLRHHIRWCEVGYLQECSILGHLFDTACFAYFMSLELDPINERLASQRFFMGIFHDIAEAWTTDIPSPIKDHIVGFRNATEAYEQKVLEKNVYSIVPSFLVAKLRYVMFEDEQNIQVHKAIIKGADYLSADSECWRQYVLGSRDIYFKKAIERRLPDIESGKVELTPECKKLFNFFRDYAARLNLENIYFDENL